MTQQVKKLIDRVTSGKGLLRIPAWWMRSVLRKMVDAIDRVRAAVDKVQGNVDKVRKDMETAWLEINTQVSAVQGNVDEVRSDVNSMEAKWPSVSYDKDKRIVIISDGKSPRVILKDVSVIRDSVAICYIKEGVTRTRFYEKTYNVVDGRVVINIPALTKSMSNLFRGCSDVIALDLSGMDTTGVLDMSAMFNSCWIETIDVSNFDTSSVTTMEGMFVGIKAVSLDLSSFDLTTVSNMNYMFSQPSNLESLVINEFGKNPGVTVQSIFNMCDKLSKQSILYILRDHSFDRAKAGYSALAVTVPNLSKLTDAEKAAITAKGFTLS